MEVPMARQWQTVLVSVVAHVAALFLLVVVPLLAFDGLPALRSAVEYIPVEMKVPPMPAAPQPVTPAPSTAAPSPGPPLVPPDKILPEVERPPLPSINMQTAPGAVPVTGLGPASVPGNFGVT